MAGLQSSEGRMMIDLVVWAQYININQRDRHVAKAYIRANALRRATKNSVTVRSVCEERRKCEF